MNLVSTLGIDLAKNTFSLHGVNSNGEVVLRRTLSRAKLSELVAQLQPCLIGMEACSGAHEWARRFAACGHTVKLMAAKFVTPYTQLVQYFQASRRVHRRCGGGLNTFRLDLDRGRWSVRHLTLPN